MGRFDFQSPGAEASDQIRQFLVQREAKKRQDMLDTIAAGRENRLAQADADQHQLQVAQLASIDAQRKQNEAATQQAMQEKASADFAKAHLPGDVVSESDAAAHPDMVDRSQPTLPAMMAAVAPGTTPGGTASTVADATKQAPVETQPMPTPGQAAQTIESKPAENVYKGDAEQRRKAKMQDDVESILTSNPDLRKNPTVDAMIKISAATGDYSGLYTALGSIANKADDTSAIFRTDPTRHTVQQMVNGQWVDYTGSALPKNHVMLQEPNQPNPNGSGAQQDARLDRSYTYNQNAIDKLRTPLEQQADKLSKLRESLSTATGAIDPLVAPEMMSAIAGGQGSGVRVTQAEISAMTHGRSTLEDFRAMWQKVKDGTSITPEQRQQLSQFAALVQQKVQAKMDILDNASNDLLSATSVDEHRKITQKARKDYHSEMSDTGSNKKVGRFEIVSEGQ